MTNILFVSSSPRGAESASLKVGLELVESLKQKNPGATVVHRDLAAKPLPHIDGAWLGAVFTPEDARSADQKALAAISDAAIDELFAADIVIVASGMINFSIPSTLKAWIDNVVRSGRTFKYGDAGTPVPLLPEGKKLYLVEARGGIYTDTAYAPYNHQAPYLKGVLGFIGLTDSDVIPVEGLAYGPEAAQKAIAGAIEIAKAA